MNHQRIHTVTRYGWLCGLLLIAVMVVGCGETDEVSLSKSEIALATGQPQEALSLAEKVLENQPNNLTAMTLRCRALMSLARFDDSRAELDKLLAAHADDVSAHELAAEWVFRRARMLMGHVNFKIDPPAQRELHQILDFGKAHADWFVQTGADPIEGHIIASDCATIAARAYSLAGGAPDPGEYALIEESDPEQLVNDALREAIQHLDLALKEDPNLGRTVAKMVRLLSRLGENEKLWALLDRNTDLTDLAAAFAVNIAHVIMTVPEEFKPASERSTVGLRILSAVTDSQQESTAWRLSAARLYQLDHRWSEAHDLLSTAQRDDPQDLKVRYWLAFNHYGAKNYSDAIELLFEIEEQGYRSAEVKTLCGLALMRQGRTDDARRQLHQATEINPNDRAAREAVLELILLEGYASASSHDLAEYLNRYPTDPRALRVALQIGVASGDRAYIERLLKGLGKFPVLEPPILKILADGYIYLGDLDRVEYYANELLHAGPDALKNHMFVAWVLARRNKEPELVERLSVIHERFPEAPAPAELIGQLFVANDPDRAIQSLQQALEDDPDNDRARLFLAKAYAMRARPKIALAHAKRVLDRRPDDLEARAFVIRLYRSMGDIEQAQAQMAGLDEQAVDEQRYPALLAWLRIIQGDTDDALAICNRAVLAGHTDALLRLTLIDLYRSRDNVSAAETHLFAMVQDQPDNPDVYSMIARHFIERGDMRQGMRKLEKLRSLNPPLTALTRATMLREMNLPEVAEADLVMTMKSLIAKNDRRVIWVTDELAKSRAKAHQPEEIQALYQQLIDADVVPERAALRQIDFAPNRDVALIKLRDLAGKITPQKQGTALQVMRRLLQLGDAQTALAMVDRLVSEANDPQAFLRWRADILSRSGQVADATATLRQLVERAPEDTQARIRLAQQLIDTLEFAGAEEQLLAVVEGGGRSAIHGYSGLARLYIRLGLYHRAVALIDSIESNKIQPNDALHLAAAQAFSALEQYNRATEHLASITQWGSEYPVGQLLLARIEERTQSDKDARDRLSNLARASDLAPVIVEQLLLSKLRDPHFQRIAAWFDEALVVADLPPALQQRWLGLRIALQAETGEWSRVAKTLERLIILAKDRPELIAARLAILSSLGKFDEGIDQEPIGDISTLAPSSLGPLIVTLLGKAAEEQPNEVALARLLRQLLIGDTDAARETLNGLNSDVTVFQSDLVEWLGAEPNAAPPDPKAIRKIAWAYIALVTKVPQLAEELTSVAALRYPEMAIAHAIYAKALIDQGKPTAPALDLIQNALPDSSLAHFLDARQFADVGLDESAAEQLQRVLERDPTSYHTRYSLGLHQQYSDQIEQAIETFEQLAKQPNPYQAAANNNLAFLLATHRPDRLDEAKTLALNALRASPQEPALYDTLGWIEYQRGDYPAAVKLLARALLGLPESSETQYHLGAAYLGLGDNRWARFHLEAARTKGDGPYLEKINELLDQLSPTVTP